MTAAWYEKAGAGEGGTWWLARCPEPLRPGQGEVRIRIAVSGINPGDVKKRSKCSASACHARA